MSQGTSSALGAAVNLTKYCIGAGVLALPYSTAKGGLLFSPIMIGIVAGWNAIASMLMISCRDTCRDASFPAHLSSTYSKIAHAGGGWFGVLVTDVSIILTLLGVCVAFQITFATLLYDVPGNPFTFRQLAVISGIVAYPVSCFRNLDSVSYLSMAGMVCLIAGVLAIIGHGIDAYGSAAIAGPLTGTRHDGTEIVELSLWPTSIESMMSFTGVSIFCFDICSLAFPIEESMLQPKEFMKSVIWSLVFVWVVYVLLGDTGAIMYVHDKKGIKENILSNLPVHSVTALLVRWAMACVGIMTFPVTLAPAAKMLEHYASNLCTSKSSSSKIQSSASKFTYGTVGNDDMHQPQEADDATSGVQFVTSSKEYAAHVSTAERGQLEPLQTDSKFQGVKYDGKEEEEEEEEEVSILVLLVNRLFLVGVTTLVATYVPCFGSIISLLGGCTISILDFILPPFLHLQIVGRGIRYDINGVCKNSDIIKYSAIEKAEDSVEERLAPQSKQSLDGVAEFTREQNKAWIIISDALLLLIGVIVCIFATIISIMDIVDKIADSDTC